MQEPQRDPQKVILEMSAHIKELRGKLDAIATIAHYDSTMEEPNAPCNREIMQMILESLATEHDAEFELAYNAMTMFQSSINSNYEHDLREIANAVVSFGHHLLRELKRYQLYRAGSLPYQFQGWIDHDLILALDTTAIDKDTLNALMNISRYDPDPGI